MNRKLLGSFVAFGFAMASCGSDDDITAVNTSAPTRAPEASGAPSATDAATSLPETTDQPAPDTTARGASAAPGLDPAFGTDGLLATPITATDDDRFISVVEGPDGLIYASGFTAIGDDHAFAVSRFNPDGTADDAFGDGGTATVNVTVGGGGAEAARGLVVHDDGKVVVAGSFEKDPTADGQAAGDLDVAVVRLEPNGTPDATFGEGGIARIDLGAGRSIDAETYITDNAWGLTARAGGYAAFAVTPNQDPDRTDTDYAIVGLTDTGALDPTFGTGGVVIADVDASGDSARNISTDAAGNIVANGYSRDGDGIVSPVLVKVDAQGVLDESFGDGGIANHIVLPGVTESYNFDLQGDNYILAGYGRGEDTEATVDMVVYRFLADGSLDASFGAGGVTQVDLAGEDDRARNVTVLPNGNILVVGSGKLDADNVDALVVMLDLDGAPLTSFGAEGHVLVDLGGSGDAFFGVTLLADASGALLAGYKGADPDGAENDDAYLARVAL